MITICVVTKVPDESDPSNLAAPEFRLFDRVEEPNEENNYLGKWHPSIINTATILTYRTPVFYLGEILLLDHNGREVGPHGRKPENWNVQCTMVDNIPDAVALSRKVLEEEDDRLWERLDKEDEHL